MATAERMAEKDLLVLQDLEEFDEPKVCILMLPIKDELKQQSKKHTFLEHIRI